MEFLIMLLIGSIICFVGGLAIDLHVYGSYRNIISKEDNPILNAALEDTRFNYVSTDMIMSRDYAICNSVDSLLFKYYIISNSNKSRHLILKGSKAHKRISKEYERLHKQN